MLFKLSLAEQEYTFVTKVKIEQSIPYLRHEGCVYYHLHKLQCQLIPVYLGNLDLDVPWFRIGVELVHIRLLSYNSKDLHRHPVEDPWQQAADFESIIAPLRVKHEDLRSISILWNEELQRVICINSEISTLDPQRQRRSSKSKAPKATSPKAKSPKNTTKDCAIQVPYHD